MAVYKIRASRVNNANAAQFTGQVNEEGQIWYGPDGVLRIYDGNPGGRVLGSNSPVDISGLANVATTGDYTDLINTPSTISWNTSGSNDEYRTIDSFTESGISYTVRNVSINNDNKLQLELARFSPTVSAAGQSRSWDQAATAFTVSVINPDDFVSRYLSAVDSITAATGIHTTIGDYTAGSQSASPDGGVDWTQTFSTNSTARIYSNGTGVNGGSATADIVFRDNNGTAWPTTATISYSWSSVNVTVSFANLTGKNFLESYASVGYTVSVTGISDNNNANTTVTAIGGSLSNSSASGTMTFTEALHKNNNSGRSISVSTDFSRPETVTGTAYVVTDSASDTTISASFTYPSFYVWTADTNTPPTRSNIVSGYDFAPAVIELGNSSRNINTTINNAENTPRAFWFGVVSSATQPSTFQTGASSALLSDVSVSTGNTVDLEPDTPGPGYVAVQYRLYGITLQPGDTYVRIS